MQAAVVAHPGGPEVLEFREFARPEPRSGWALVHVRAFGLNRSELLTRAGASGESVRFPRVLGIEAVGTVEAVAAGSALRRGQTVAAAMGGMGRAFDGSYAEYALLPERQLMVLQTELDWPVLAALPLSWLTALGSLDAAQVRAGQTVLVTGASSSVGVAAVSLARQRGATVVATTRSADKTPKLRVAGAHHAIVVSDADALAKSVAAVAPEGPDAVVDLVGGPTLLAALRVVRRGGTVCNTGILDGWSHDGFQPLEAIPASTKLTVYESGRISADESTAALQRIVDDVGAGHLTAHLDRVFALPDIAAAHAYMEANRATGKVVVSTAAAGPSA